MNNYYDDNADIKWKHNDLSSFGLYRGYFFDVTHSGTPYNEFESKKLVVIRGLNLSKVHVFHINRALRAEFKSLNVYKYEIWRYGILLIFGEGWRSISIQLVNRVMNYMVELLESQMISALEMCCENCKSHDSDDLVPIVIEEGCALLCSDCLAKDSDKEQERNSD